MNREQWQRRITHSVKCAADGIPKPLETLAQMMADADTAREALVAHGYGSDGDGLMDLVATVIEANKERTIADGIANA